MPFPATINGHQVWPQPVYQIDSSGAAIFGAGGTIGSPADLIDITLTLDTLIYAAGDVHSDSVVITNAVRAVGGRAILNSLTVHDEDDQAAAGLDLVFFGSNVTLGAKNAVPAISDIDARQILGIVSLVAGDFKDLGGVKIGTLRNIGLLVEAGAASRDIYVQTVTQGTPTQTAAGMRLRLGFLQN